MTLIEGAGITILLLASSASSSNCSVTYLCTYQWLWAVDIVDRLLTKMIVTRQPLHGASCDHSQKFYFGHNNNLSFKL